jgi:hypothetical protein
VSVRRKFGSETRAADRAGDRRRLGNATVVDAVNSVDADCVAVAEVAREVDDPACCLMMLLQTAAWICGPVILLPASEFARPTPSPLSNEWPSLTKLYTGIMAQNSAGRPAGSSDHRRGAERGVSVADWRAVIFGAGVASAADAILLATRPAEDMSSRLATITRRGRAIWDRTYAPEPADHGGDKQQAPHPDQRVAVIRDHHRDNEQPATITCIGNDATCGHDQAPHTATSVKSDADQARANHAKDRWAFPRTVETEPPGMSGDSISW